MQNHRENPQTFGECQAKSIQEFGWTSQTNKYKLAQMSFIFHIHNYTEYNEEWNVFSAFNPSKWSSGAADIAGAVGGSVPCSSGLTSVVDTFCQSQDSKTTTLVYLGFQVQRSNPLGHDLPN